jgi:hypothetical protein
VKVTDLEPWLKSRMAEVESLLQALRTSEKEVSRAVGQPGTPGDLALLVFVARSIGAPYQEALEWELRVRRIAGDPQLKKVAESIDRLVDDIVAKIEALGPRLLATLAELDAYRKRGEPLPARSVTLKIDLPGVDEATATIHAIVREVLAKRR